MKADVFWIMVILSIVCLLIGGTIWNNEKETQKQKEVQFKEIQYKICKDHKYNYDQCETIVDQLQKCINHFDPHPEKYKICIDLIQ